MTDSKQLTPEALHAALASTTPPLVIDVRGEDEFAAAHVPGAVNIPLVDLEDRLVEIPDGQPVVTYCLMQHPGASRGERAAALLQSHGIDALSLTGGLPAWTETMRAHLADAKE